MSAPIQLLIELRESIRERKPGRRALSHFSNALQNAFETDEMELVSERSRKDLFTLLIDVETLAAMIANGDKVTGAGQLDVEISSMLNKSIEVLTQVVAVERKREGACDTP
jgi:hypothetical protein